MTFVLKYNLKKKIDFVASKDFIILREMTLFPKYNIKIRFFLTIKWFKTRINDVCF